MSAKKPEYKRTRITVIGKEHFPFDMLRYDSCVPVAATDAHMIDLASPSISAQISLYRFSVGGRKASVDRWIQFGWTIIYDDGI